MKRTSRVPAAWPGPTDESIQAFAGPNAAYFIYHWKLARGFARWNLSACLFGPFWFALRRDWVPALILAALYLLFDLLVTTNPYQFTLPVELMLAAGLAGNAIYYRRFQGVDAAARRSGSEAERLAALRQAGGRDWRGAAGLLAGMLAMTLLLPLALGVDLFRTRVVRLEVGSIVWTLARPEVRTQELWLLRQDAQQAFLQGQFERSLAVTANAFRLAELKLGSEDPLTLGLQNDLITDNLRAGEYAKARRLTEEGLKAYQLQFGKDHLFVAFMLNQLVANDLYQGRYDLARSESFNALLIVEAYKPKADDAFLQNSLAALYSNLAVVQQAYGEFDSAEKNHREALDLALRAAQGPTLQVATYLERLGDWHLEQLQLDEAEDLYGQEQRLAERTLGVENPLMSSILLKQGELHYLRGQFAQAEPLVRQALQIDERFFDRPHTATAESACQLGRVCFAEGKLSEAQTYLAQSLDVTRRAIGQDNAIYAADLVQLADLDAFRNDLDAAERELTAAAATFTRIYGPDHPRLLIPLEPLAVVYEKLGRPLAQQATLERVQRIKARATRPLPNPKPFRLDKNTLVI